MDDGNASEDDSRTTAPTDTADATSTLDADVLDLQYVFEALAHPRRRYLVSTLREERPWTLTELATEIATWEYDVHVDAVDESERHGVYVSLLHAHVPKLVAADVVEFDPDAKTVARGPNAERALAVLECAGGSLDSDRAERERGEDDD